MLLFMAPAYQETCMLNGLYFVRWVKIVKKFLQSQLWWVFAPNTIYFAFLYGVHFIQANNIHCLFKKKSHMDLIRYFGNVSSF